MLVLLALLGVVCAFAVGAWLTNFGAGQGVPARGGGIDPNDWSAAANLICADTNADVVEIEEELADDRVAALAATTKALARRIDGIVALPGPSGQGDGAAALIAEMRRLQADALRALEKSEQAGEGSTLAVRPALERRDLTRRAYAMDVPWCALLGADDEAVRRRAAGNIMGVERALERYRAAEGSYGGADLELLRAEHGLTVAAGEVALERTSAEGYCIESTVGYLTSHLSGPAEQEPSAGPC